MPTTKHRKSVEHKPTSQDQIVEAAIKVLNLRKRPLLILFYPTDVRIAEFHNIFLTALLKQEGLRRAEPLPELDVLIQTFGGNPLAAYQLAQIIHNYAKDVQFLVPEYAYSAGTAVCLSGSCIHLGENASLSPIDITLTTLTNTDDEQRDTYQDETPDTEVETVGIDNFIQVARQARIEMEQAFRQRHWRTSRTDVESNMMCELVKQLGSLTIARYHREKNVAHEYARILLLSYMFPQDHGRVNRVLRRLIAEAPSHEFNLDYHLCIDAGLKVQEMDDDLSDASQEIARVLSSAATDDETLFKVDHLKVPLIQFYRYTEGQSDQAGISDTAGEEASDVATNGR